MKLDFFMTIYPVIFSMPDNSVVKHVHGFITTQHIDFNFSFKIKSHFLKAGNVHSK